MGNNKKLLYMISVNCLVIKKALLLSFVLICLGKYSFSAIGISVANSTWTTAGTWSFNGVNRLPNCADSISIESGKTVTIDSQVDYSNCGTPMIIYVYGVLQFTNGNKLDLPCGSIVYIMSGGLIKKSTAGGGNSTLISICGVDEWIAGDGPLPGIDTLGTVISLPIELISFEAVKGDEGVKLMWSTATEINNQYFTLERSEDAKNFSVIEKISGTGNSSFINSYSCLDKQPLNGVSYYRLSQTDYDGKKVTFPPVAIRLAVKQKNNIVVLQNPFLNKIVFSTTQIEKGELQISLFTVEGKKVLEEKINSDSFSVYTIDDLGKLKNGIYLLSINLNDHPLFDCKVLKE